MSVPGRIGIILIVALALLDGVILMSGAKRAASAIETHAMANTTVPPMDSGPVDSRKSDRLLSTALRRIDCFVSRPAAEMPNGT